MHTNAILFDFPDEHNTHSAYQLLLELGYDPMKHSETRLHIHVEAEDLTSALEIAQAYGGVLVEQQRMEEELIASTAYGLNDIVIPAHMVNEDLIAEEEQQGSVALNELSHFDEMSSFSAYDQVNMFICRLSEEKLSQLQEL